MSDISISEIQGFKCTNCDTLWADEPEYVVLYECGDCGEIFSRENSYTGDGHQCPSCHKFSAKLTDRGCPDCQEGEVEGEELHQCEICEEVFDDSEKAATHFMENHADDDQEEDDNG
jgi:uncharacterized C2H2 Zn-finger protein